MGGCWAKRKGDAAGDVVLLKIPGPKELRV